MLGLLTTLESVHNVGSPDHSGISRKYRVSWPLRYQYTMLGLLGISKSVQNVGSPDHSGPVMGLKVLGSVLWWNIGPFFRPIFHHIPFYHVDNIDDVVRVIHIERRVIFYHITHSHTVKYNQSERWKSLNSSHIHILTEIIIWKIKKSVICDLFWLKNKPRCYNVQLEKRKENRYILLKFGFGLICCIPSFNLLLSLEQVKS